jgi:hypothetical protein
MVSYGDRLCIGYGYSDGDVWEYNDGTNTWTQIGGNGIKSSWADGTFEWVYELCVWNGLLVAGLGISSGDAEVWTYNGTTWTKIGGDGVNSSWNTGYEYVMSLCGHNGNLMAGLGHTGGDAEVWEYNGSSWTKIAGDGVNSSWDSATADHDGVHSLCSIGGYLYAGLGSHNSEAEVWEYNNSAWTKIGGDGVNSSWADAVYQRVQTMCEYHGNLYVGLGEDTGEAEVWEYVRSTSTWTKVGGDGVNSSWNTVYETVYSMCRFNDQLTVGLGSGSGDSEVWQYNGSTWTKIGGDTLYSSWGATIEYCSGLAVHNKKLYAGLAVSDGDAEVWELAVQGITTTSTTHTTTCSTMSTHSTSCSTISTQSTTTTSTSPP